MKILLVIPSFGAHGGIRVLTEFACGLSKWHQVDLHSLKSGDHEWLGINGRCNVVDQYDLKDYDCLIIGSPHSIDLIDHTECPKKVFHIILMAEHFFRPDDKEWYNKCLKFYTSKHPLLSISQWNIELFKELGRTGKTHYIGNGVNLDQFPIKQTKKDGKTILVEGWESLNPSKDPKALGPKVARMLKYEGYKILAYSQVPLKTYRNVPDEYYQKPSLEKLNELYERATILIKATKMDARACCPVECMTKGTVTARALDFGDDDLINGENCLRTNYNFENLYKISKELLTNDSLRNTLSKNCIEYVQKYNYDYWCEKINKIITNN